MPWEEAPTLWIEDGYFQLELYGLPLSTSHHQRRRSHMACFARSAPTGWLPGHDPPPFRFVETNRWPRLGRTTTRKCTPTGC